MTLHTLLRAAALCGICCLAAPDLSLAQERTTPEEKEALGEPLHDARLRVGALLTGHHHMPTAEQIEQAHPEARAALASLALDEELFLLYRRRALVALVNTWPDTHNLALLEKLVEREDDALLRTSLKLLLVHAGQRGVEVVRDTLLHDARASHRSAALDATAHLSESSRRELLALALTTEPDPDLTQRIEAILGTLSSHTSPE